MYLYELIEQLESRDPSKVVLNGFGKGMSWRGSYDEAAFEPVDETTYGEMLEHAKALLDSTQVGYKGGEYLMHGHCDVHIADYGSIGEPINSYNFKAWDAC